ncbi:MAG: MMPL family transporter, partial [Salinisphaeraceae bacterium]|nr:MMPL family transporter [Salinisphaeraceae bacterium]
MTAITSIAEFIVRRRLWLLLLMLSLVLASGYGATRLELSTDLEVMFHPDDPQLALYNVQRDTYARDDNLYFIIGPASGNVFTRETLALVEEMTEASWQLPYAQRVDSIANYQHTQAQGDDLLVRPLVEDARSLSDEALADIRRIVMNEPILIKRLISEAGAVTGINITMQLPGLDRSKEIPEAMAAARALRDAMVAKYPDTRIGIAGKTAGNNAFSESALYDLTHIVPIALMIAIACIAFYLWFASGSVLTSLSGTFTTLLIVVTSIATALGLAGWLGYGVTPPMSNSPTMILTLAVADSMHLLVTFLQQLRRGKHREAAMVEALRINFQAIFLTSLTTAIGFLALNFSESPPFQDLGNVVAIGVVAAWLLSITLLPALMLMLPVRARREHNEQVNTMERLADWVIANRYLSMAGVSVLIITAAIFVSKNELYDVWSEYFSERTEIRQDVDYLRAHLAGMNSMEYSVASGEPGGIADPEYLAKLDQFANWLREQEHVQHVYSFSDIFKRLNKNMHGDDEAWYRLPDNRELAAQYLLLYEFSLPFGLDITNQIDMDKSATRLIVSIDTSSTKAILQLQ